MAKKETRRTIWNNRYGSANSSKGTPTGFLVDHLDLLKPGTVLDLGCGNGRNTIFLAENKFEVFGIDFSDVALRQLEEFSLKNNLGIKTMALDLSYSSCLDHLQQYDNILAVNFKLEKYLLDKIPELLKDGGIFLYCTFNQRHAEIKDFPAKFCLGKEELKDRVWSLKLIKFHSFEENNGYYDAYIFKK